MQKSNKTIIKLPTPLDYQRDIINWLDSDEVKYVSFLKSRQSGGSFLNKLLCTKWLMEQKNAKIGYITPTYKLSRLFYKELEQAIKPFIKSSNSTDLIIETITGSRVQFFSAESKDSIRGFQFHYLIIDEAAFISDDIWNFVIKPTVLVTGRKIVQCSTPCGSQGFFYNHVTWGLEKQVGYKSKCITIYDNPYVSADEIEKIKQQMPEKVFRQEYLAEFLDGSGTVFTNFKNCVIKEARKTGRYYAAIDWAKQDDFTVLTIMNDVNQVVYTYRINQVDYTQQVKLIAGKLNDWKPLVTISEENNIGTVVNELLKKEYKGIVKTVTLDNSLKKQIIESLCVAFEQQLIGIPDDEVLIRELQAFTCTYNPNTQTVKYSAPYGLHDDMIISLAYAYYAVKSKINNYKISFICTK